MVNCDDPFLFKYIEGSQIHKAGDYFLSLLSPQQVVERDLSVREVIDIYRQGIKDPAIMDRNCMLGNKAYLLTYHARTLLKTSSFLLPCSSPSHIVMSAYRDAVIVYWNDKQIFTSRKEYSPAREDVKDFAYYKWKN